MQEDYVISDQTGVSFLSDLNATLAAIVSNNSGATAPSTTYAYMLWADTTAGILKQRNAANNAWINRGSLTGITAAEVISVATGNIAATDVQAAINELDAQRKNKNLLINADFRINQRAYVSTTATAVANQYTLDRWRVVVSGQSISFSTLGTDNTITCPAGGLGQKIEALNVQGGTYVINWTGTATCTVDGAAKTKGATVTLTANTQADVIFSSGTVKEAQLEKGLVSTNFEYRSVGEELALCQRYYEKSNFFRSGVIANNTNGLATESFITPKRVNATVSFITEDLINFTGSNITNTTEHHFDHHPTGGVAGQGRYRMLWQADAEL